MRRTSNAGSSDRPPPDTLAVELFGREQVERARRYHRAVYVAWAANTGIGVAVLALLAWPAPETEGRQWALAATAVAAICVAGPWLARLPLGYAAGYRRERRWGFSTQMPLAWLGDRAKALAVTLGLTVPLMVGLVGLGRALPTWWPLVAAAGGAAFVLLVSFVAPVVIEPLFNRFEPLADEELARALRTLAERAGVPVRDVLVSDASRRTTKVNAYVSGVGRTRRVVLFDTLLRKSSPAEVGLVVAHELGHRRARHVLQGTLLAMAGTVVAVLVVWAVVGTPGPGDIPVVLLLGALLELAGLPVGTAISRAWERSADRFSIELTGDSTVFEETHRKLALENLSDLDPPRAVYLLLFTHPTPPQRISAGREWADALA